MTTGAWRPFIEPVRREESTAIDAGHVEVEKDEIGTAVSAGDERIRAVNRQADVIPLVTEHIRHDGADRLFVIDDEHARPDVSQTHEDTS